MKVPLVRLALAGVLAMAWSPAAADEGGTEALKRAMGRFHAGELREAAKLLADAAVKLPPGPARAQAYLHEGLAQKLH